LIADYFTPDKKMCKAQRPSGFCAKKSPARFQTGRGRNEHITRYHPDSAHGFPWALSGFIALPVTGATVPPFQVDCSGVSHPRAFSHRLAPTAGSLQVKITRLFAPSSRFA